MSRWSRLATVLAACAVAFALVAPPAQADEKDACATAAESAQSLRRGGKLVEAHAQLLICAASSCPAVVGSFCAQWLRDVDVATPSIVLRAEDARGQDVIAVHVTIDGTPASDRLDGIAIPVDPGPHRLTFEAKGAPPETVEVLVAEGEKDRAVKAHFEAKLRADGTSDEEERPAPSSPRPQEPAENHKAANAPSFTLAAIAGGVAVLSLGAFVYLDLSSWSDYRQLHGSCGSTCTPADVSGVQTKIDVSAVFLGVGVVALGITAWQLLTQSRRSDPQPATTGLRITAAGVAASF